MDEWVEIEGYPKYFANRNGQIKGQRGTIMKQFVNNRNGYVYIDLRDKDSKRKTWLVHRLLAKTFIPNPDNLACVDHIDGHRKNNNLDNLRWVSKQDNTRYRHRQIKTKHGLPRGVCKRSDGKKYTAHVKQYYKDIHLGSFNTIYEAELARLNWERDNWGEHLMTKSRVSRHEALKVIADCIDKI